MVLASSDELRHAHDDGFNWRESLYFNFADAANGLGGWIYLWVVPNKPLKSGMLVSIYKGVTDRLEANQLALEAPEHRYVGDQDNWVYCYKQDIGPLVAEDFDDIELCGLHLVREAPLQTYRATFSDDNGSELELRIRFAMQPYDYADGPHHTPSWVAKNRYHRATKVEGTFRTGGRNFSISGTGDSDHSWGERDMDEFSKHTFKMWSFQSPDTRRSVSVIEQGAGLFLGFVNVDGYVCPVQHIQHSTRYTETGLQRDIEVRITDTAGRVVRGRMLQLFSAIGHGEPAGLWGFEGVGRYTVDDWGVCTGVASYFWPPHTTPKALQERRANRID